jgi:hypothetical protein
MAVHNLFNYTLKMRQVTSAKIEQDFAVCIVIEFTPLKRCEVVSSFMAIRSLFLMHQKLAARIFIRGQNHNLLLPCCQP